MMKNYKIQITFSTNDYTRKYQLVFFIFHFSFLLITYKI